MNIFSRARTTNMMSVSFISCKKGLMILCGRKNNFIILRDFSIINSNFAMGKLSDGLSLAHHNRCARGKSGQHRASHFLI